MATGINQSETPVVRTTTEAREEFEGYLKTHPEAAENSAGVVAAFAIIRAHQCQTSN